MFYAMIQHNNKLKDSAQYSKISLDYCKEMVPVYYGHLYIFTTMYMYLWFNTKKSNLLKLSVW